MPLCKAFVYVPLTVVLPTMFDIWFEFLIRGFIFLS